MQRRRKTIYLITALLLPVALFLFLKFFGRNQFEVPVLFQDSVAHRTDCIAQYPVPYVIPDSVMDRFAFKEGTQLMVFAFTDESGTAQQESIKHVNRIEEEFADDGVVVRRISPGEDHTSYRKLRECTFLLQGDTSAALVDNQGRIRGQYKVNTLEEADRLAVELKIILKKY